jgi:WD40 repeat protein
MCNFRQFFSEIYYFDKIVRVWDIKKKKVIDYINVKDLITSIAYFPSGNQVAIGFHNGKVNVFDLNVLI